MLATENAIIWFRNDLRIHDNEVLSKAIKNSKFIIPIICIDPSLFQENVFGAKKIGKFRAKFLVDSIIDLRNSFHKKKGKLLVFVGKPEVIIPKIALKYHCKKVYAQKEIASEELITENLVEKALWLCQVSLQLIWGQTLFHPDDLPFSTKDIPDIFTNFRKNIELESTVRNCIAINEKFYFPPDLEDDKLPDFKKLGLVCETDTLFKGGESEGLKRLNYYLYKSRLIQTYKETRNGLLGLNYSSKFSPWLALGCVSPRHIYWEIKKYEQEIAANDSTYWLVFELLWRDYFKFVFKKYGNKLFQENGLKSESKTEKCNDTVLFEKWITGTLGVPFVDANMRELAQKGYMSNRGRQNVASYFVHYLNLPWLDGAAYFEEMLIDYDVCSNYGNWAYFVEGGDDHRENRVFNIAKQAKDYDPKAEYVKHWCPELASLSPQELHNQGFKIKF